MKCKKFDEYLSENFIIIYVFILIVIKKHFKETNYNCQNESRIKIN